MGRALRPRILRCGAPPRASGNGALQMTLSRMESSSEPKFVTDARFVFRGLVGLAAIAAAPCFALLLLVPAPLVLPVLSLLSFATACIVALYAFFTKASRDAQGLTSWNIAYVFTLIWIFAAVMSSPRRLLDWFEHLSMIS